MDAVIAKFYEPGQIQRDVSESDCALILCLDAIWICAHEPEGQGGARGRSYFVFGWIHATSYLTTPHFLTLRNHHQVLVLK